ncbi:hypothetical protein C7384_10938 [Convivina intestini]|uniref:Uncharacterized protein n=2 Tax=Convivina TaxID=1697027 RepID=A0A2U1D607_9LACO|nr:hypothetical protein C7384_10938 [Convivina intestini]CAH1849975.1 hypothetical protein R078138_00040 [Convivina sp. LMG 32447]CAH1856156.1 hypothetical protein LMG032447_01243 [Convivina sp. LMG 32447]CAH1856610.1 hypothetical protein R077811_01291 [Convivina intestini]
MDHLFSICSSVVVFLVAIVAAYDIGYNTGKDDTRRK